MRFQKTVLQTTLGMTVLLAGATAISAQENWAEICNPDGNQQEITACLAAEEQDARAKLADTLARIAERYADQAEQLAALDTAQVSWEEQVEVDLNAYLFVPEGENPQFLYGSSYAMSFLDARLQLIEQRIAFLETNWLPDR